MKTLIGTMVLVSAVFFSTACAIKAGEGCTGNEPDECGKELTCVICNAAADAGSDVSAGTCQKICTADSECVGTESVFGPTTICAQNTCGMRYCSVNPF